MSSLSASDVLSYKSVGEVQVAADGSRLCYVISDPYRHKGEAKERSSVWVQELGGGVAWCASSGIGFPNHPSFSPDGFRIAFTGIPSGSGSDQLFLHEAASGRTVQLTSLDMETDDFQWSPDGSRLFMLLSEKAPPPGDPEEFEADARPSCLYSLEHSSGELLRLSGAHHIWDFSVSPDGTHAAALVSDEPYEWAWHVSSLSLLDLRNRTSRTVHNPHPRQMGALRWSPDGKEIFFISSIISDRGLIGGDLYALSPFSGGRVRNLTQDSIGTVHWYDFAADGKILLLSTDMGRSVFSRLDTAASSPGPQAIGRHEFWINPFYHPRFSFSSSAGMIAVVREDPSMMQEVWTGRITGNSVDWVQQTRLNEGRGEKLEGACTLVEWKASDGLAMQGFLYHKPGEEKGRPLVVSIHGGPSEGYGFRFNPRARYFISRGFNVFEPNPRGSTGRGPGFSELNRGNIGGRDFDDIVDGINHLTANGLADRSNLFVMGGSYGGYLVAWAVTQKDMFNAAVMNFGISNLLSCHGTEWNIYWDEFLFGIDPYREPEKYHMKSPIDHVLNAKTPTLILHGKDDPCVPVSQGREMFRALKELGVETRLIVYPREKHGWTEREHIIDAMQRQADWFTAHLSR